MDKLEGPFKEIEEIYEEHYLYIMKFLLRLTHERQLCEDIVQEVFIKLITNPYHLVGIKSLRSWLIKLSKNRLIDYYRKNKPVVISDEQLMDELIDHSFSFEESVIEKKSVMEILNRLSTEEKAIIIARDYYGYTYEELGAIFEISLSSVKSRLFRARKSFLKYYREVSSHE